MAAADNDPDEFARGSPEETVRAILRRRAEELAAGRGGSELDDLQRALWAAVAPQWHGLVKLVNARAKAALTDCAAEDVVNDALLKACGFLTAQYQGLHAGFRFDPDGSIPLLAWVACIVGGGYRSQGKPGVLRAHLRAQERRRLRHVRIGDDDSNDGSVPESGLAAPSETQAAVEALELANWMERTLANEPREQQLCLRIMLDYLLDLLDTREELLLRIEEQIDALGLDADAASRLEQLRRDPDEGTADQALTKGAVECAVARVTGVCDKTVRRHYKRWTTFLQGHVLSP